MDLGSLSKLVDGAKKVNDAYARIEQKVDLINAKLDKIISDQQLTKTGPHEELPEIKT